MPGLFGYTDHNGAFGNNDAILSKMRNLLIYTNKPHKSEPFYHGIDENNKGNNIHAGYCAPEFETVDEHPAADLDVSCWFDGEIYNAGDLAAVCGNSFVSPTITTLSAVSTPIGAKTAKELLLSAYKNGSIRECLRKINGYFSAVICDRQKRQVLLMTDRFGFRHLFYTIIGKNLFWASECKAFLAVPEFKLNVNRQSVDEFLRFGSLRENRTWFDGTYILDPAAIVTFNTLDGNITEERYYAPDEVKPFADKINIYEYCEEWGHLFKLAVARRTNAAERTGLTLSGGLDSRAILAAMPLDGRQISAVTMGDYRCDDARFAARACKVKGAHHHIFPLKKDGWLNRAMLGVWATDGALNVSSQLGIEHLGAFSELFEVNMTGMGGGVMQGGMEPGASVYDASGNSETGLCGLNMRNRRMIRAGFRLDESFFKTRIPYYDNDLYDFVMSVPRELRKKGVLINKALLHNFPQYFKSIPWQKTGVPISLPPPLFEAATLFKRFSSRAKRKLQRFGLPVSDTKLYFNVSEALNHDSNSALAEKILSAKDAIYPQYLPKDFAVETIHKYANLKLERKFRLLTFEIWMRQAAFR